MKKIVAMLLIVATLVVPFCGLADMGGTAEAVFALTNDWLPMGTIEGVSKDALCFMWFATEKYLAFVCDQESYVYLGSQADLLSAACAAVAYADDNLTYGKDWFFIVDGECYTKTQVTLYILRYAEKYKN